MGKEEYMILRVVLSTLIWLIFILLLPISVGHCSFLFYNR